MRSAPTSLGGSYRIGIPVFTPGSMTSGSWPRYCRQSATTTEVRGGTTLARATPAIWAMSTFEAANRLRTRIPYSSAVCSRRVVRRQCALSSSPSWTPSTVFVLPTSMVRRKGIRWGLGSISVAGGPYFVHLAGMEHGARAVRHLQHEASAVVEVPRDAAEAPAARPRLHRASPPGHRSRPPRRRHDVRSFAL